jgi:DNA-binding NtrC family response regulator
MNSVGSDLRTVLVVDDEPDLCEIIRRMLDGNGYPALTAHGVTDAIAKSAAHPGPITLLVTDLRMPDGDGRLLATTIRATRPGTPVVYMTGLPPEAGPVAELIETNATVLAKPFTIADLMTAVATALDTG